MDFLEQIKEKARSRRMRIVLPESYEERTLKAADEIIADGIADVILIGDREKIAYLASESYLDNIIGATIVDPADNPRREHYIDLMLNLRASKGLTREEAGRLVSDPLYLAAVMIKAGDADGEVAGALNTTGDVLRPAFQYVRTLPGINVVSGAFIMIVPDTLYGQDGMMLFADCAVNPDPTARELAEIAVATGNTARTLAGIEPRVAMLSFSTMGSGRHEAVDKVVEATRLAKEMAPDMVIEGELQVDAAIVPGVSTKKAPGSKVGGRANVLVFPTLDAGNIGYKLVQRLARAEAIGPVLQGMAAPVNDLSRGCSVDDIVSLVAITACQAQADGRIASSDITL